MVKVVVNNEQGLVQYAGSGFQAEKGLRIKAGVSGTTVRTDQIFGAEGPLVADPYAETAAQFYPLGAKLTVGDKTFRYAKNGSSTLGVGEIVQALTEVGNDSDRGTNQIDSAYAAIGDTVVSLALGGDPGINYFTEGYLTVIDGTGEGQVLKIASNAAGADPCLVTVLDPFHRALSASSKVTVIANPYTAVVKATAPANGAPLGVAPNAVTADYYFWLQTGGPAPVKQGGSVGTDTAPAIGIAVGVSAGEAGQGVKAVSTDGTAANNNSQIIGYCLSSSATDSETCLVMLNLDH